MARIKKGDLVLVCSGADSGKRGRVLRVIPGKNRAVVEGVSVRFKHLKKSQKHPQGGRVQRETALHLSKLMPIDPTTDEATRVSYRIEGDRKIRVSRGGGNPLDGEAKTRAKGEGKKAKSKPEREPAAAESAPPAKKPKRAKGEE
jgi:large subunit ribosomal protein L24